MMVRAAARSPRRPHRLSPSLAAAAVSAALLSSSSSRIPSAAASASRAAPPRSAFLALRPSIAHLPTAGTATTPAEAAAAAASSGGPRTVLPPRPRTMSSSASEHPTEASAASGDAAAAAVTASDGSSSTVASNLETVRRRVAACASDCNRPEGSVRLVAVSKTKPVSMLREAYDAGQRRFGENYAQELMAKAEEMPSDVEWHFIGPLQSNKAAPLVKKVGVGRLKCVETVSTMKLANKLNKAVEDSVAAEGADAAEAKLGIYLQVNTSGEESKSGAAPGPELVSLARDIAESCPRLSIDGLMTIGAPGDVSCFDVLVGCRDEVAEALGRDASALELSMGMSGDFEAAIERGATSVRVGSTIFGARDYSNLKK